MDFLVKIIASVVAVLLSGSILGLLFMWKVQAVLENRVKRLEEDLAELREELRAMNTLYRDIHSDLEQVGEKLNALLRRGDSRANL